MVGIQLGTRVSLRPQKLTFQCQFLAREWNFEEYPLLGRGEWSTAGEEEAVKRQKEKQKDRVPWRQGRESWRGGCQGGKVADGRLIRTEKMRFPLWFPGLDLQPSSWSPASSSFPTDTSWTFAATGMSLCSKYKSLRLAFTLTPALWLRLSLLLVSICQIFSWSQNDYLPVALIRQERRPEEPI